MLPQSLLHLDGGPFGCVLADPPWRFDNTSTRAAAENHYPTMSTHEICALPVSEIVAKSAMLYLWVTDAHLPEVFRLGLFEAWGFRFVQQLIWLKVKDGRAQMGLGNYYRHSTEALLFGVRGKAKVKRHDALNFLQAPREEHSAKPDIFQHMIRDMSEGPYLEMFARRPFEGWSAWGLEAPPQGLTGDPEWDDR